MVIHKMDSSLVGRMEAEKSKVVVVVDTGCEVSGVLPVITLVEMSQELLALIHVRSSSVRC